MSKRRFILYTIGLAVLFGVYVGHTLYENRVKPIPPPKAIQLETNAGLKSTDRAFLQREEAVTQLARDVRKRFPSLNPPVWKYTPEKWDSDAVDSVKVIPLAQEVVGFHTTKLSDRNTYRLSLPKEKILIAPDIISDQEVIYIRIFTTPENTPEFPSPSLDEFPIPFDVPIEEESPVPYPLIAKFLNKQDDDSLTEFADWIKSVGGAVRAQSLLEAAGLSDSIRIETATTFRQ